jgi:hypothetical protein
MSDWLFSTSGFKKSCASSWLQLDSLCISDSLCACNLKLIEVMFKCSDFGLRAMHHVGFVANSCSQLKNLCYL